jgi:hypothetical protein
VKTFTDSTGQKWDLSVRFAAVRRVKDMLGLNLLSLVEDKLKPLGELLSDPCRLVDVLYVLVKPQADAAGLSDVDFGERLDGESLEAAADAFLAELFNFFPDRRAREALRKLREALVLVAKDQEEKLAKLDPASLAKSVIASAGRPPAPAD